MCGLIQEAAPLDDSREAATTAAVVNAASKAMHALLQVIQNAVKHLLHTLHDCKAAWRVQGLGLVTMP